MRGPFFALELACDPTYVPAHVSDLLLDAVESCVADRPAADGYGLHWPRLGGIDARPYGIDAGNEAPTR